MLQRFVSAAVVPGVLIAFAAGGLFLLTHVYHEWNNPYLATVGWCALPLVWGVWAMLAPKSWWPDRLERWGAILGAIVGYMVMFVLRVPDRIMAVRFPTPGKLIATAILMLLYAVLWMIVGEIHRRLTKEPEQKVFKQAA